MSEALAETAWTIEALRHNSFYTQCFFQFENWYAPTRDETFKSYFARRSSQLRNTISRK